MQPGPPLVHIGYHKTATTWLQAQFFRPEHGFHPILDHGDVFRTITGPHGLVFDAEAARAGIADRIAGTPEGLVPVISSELLSGLPFFGGRESDVFAERLHAIVPEARILVTIRAQLKILPSVYMQYLQRGGTLPHARFFTEEDDLGYTWFSPVHFEYDRLVARYQALFGAGRVHVLPQEDLARDAGAACRALADFAGAESYGGLAERALKTRGASYPEYAAPLLRRINHVQESVLNRRPIVALGRNPDGLYRAAGYLASRAPVKRALGDRRPVSAWVARHFAGRFDASNRRLAALSPVPLDPAAYGLDPAP